MNTIPSNPISNLAVNWSVLLLIALFITMSFYPEAANADISANFIGFEAEDDLFEMLVKIVANIFIFIIYLLFVLAFIGTAYVAFAGVIKMVSDREVSGELIAKVLGSVAFLVVCVWLLAKGEDAVEQMKEVDLTHTTPTSVSRVV